MAMTPTPAPKPTTPPPPAPGPTVPPSPGGAALTDASPTQQYNSNEGYIAGTEPRQDAPFHAEMLEGPNAEAADRITSLQSAIRLVEDYGASEDVAARLYGIDLDELEAQLNQDLEGDLPAEPPP